MVLLFKTTMRKIRLVRRVKCLGMELYSPKIGQIRPKKSLKTSSLIKRLAMHKQPNAHYDTGVFIMKIYTH